MSGKYSSFFNRNIVSIVMIPALILMHWGWCKLQDFETLVKKEEKKELPIIKGALYLEQAIEEKVLSFKGERKSQEEK